MNKFMLEFTMANTCDWCVGVNSEVPAIYAILTF